MFFGLKNKPYDTRPELASESDIKSINPEGENFVSLNLMLKEYSSVTPMKSRAGETFDCMRMVFVGENEDLPIEGVIFGSASISQLKKNLPVNAVIL